jgi:hypothetical protein
MSTYDPEAAARAAREAQAARAAQGAPEGRAVVKDPLPYCIYTTVCLIAWVVSPPLAITFFAGLGLRKYWRAWRAGLRDTNCLLGNPQRAMAYLGVLMVAGAGATVWNLVALVAS